MGSKAKPLSEEQIAALLTVFGPPPVLSSEDKEGYTALLKGHLAFYRPTHPMVVSLIKQLVDTQWEIFRFIRNRSEAIERRFRKWREGRLALLEHKNKETKQHLESLENFTNAQRQIIYQVEQTIKDTETRIKVLAERDATVSEHNVEMEAASDFLDRADKYLTAATARQNNLLQLLEFYCGPSEQRGEVADAEFKEVQAQEVKQITAPPVAPPEVVADDATAQDHSEPLEQSTQ